MNLAPGTRAASSRPCSTGTSPSFRRCSTSVGTRTLASIDRTSISAFICITAFTAPGLAASRSNLANNATASGFAATLGMRALMPAPVPLLHTLPDSFFDIAGIVGKSGEAPEEDDVRDALGVGGGEQDAHRAALRESEEYRAPRTDFLHDRTNVVQPLLEGGNAVGSIGQALASLVERDHAGERRKTAQKAGISKHFMRELDMRNEAWDQDDVDGPVPHCLIGDINVAAQRVACDRQYEIAHCRALSAMS